MVAGTWRPSLYLRGILYLKLGAILNEGSLDRLKAELELESLRQSAELYAETYSQDDDLKELTGAALDGWPDVKLPGQFYI